MITTYQYSKAHNRTQKVKDGVTSNYSYNNLNQLTGFSEPGRQVYFYYDDNGNRIRRTENGVVDTYAYDYENRLVSLQQGDVPYEYTYDYRTRRVERVEGDTRTKIVFSGGTSVQEYEAVPCEEGGAGGQESGASGGQGCEELKVEYIRGSDYGGGIGGILYTLREGDPSYTHYNNRGDVVAKTDADQAVTYQATYEAFGTRTHEVGETQDRQKANTKDEDPTGLLNEGFRYRDLEAGCFITRDPLGHKEGPNLYTYVHQNPWTKFDPEGLADGSTDTADRQRLADSLVVRGGSASESDRKVVSDKLSQLSSGRLKGMEEQKARVIAVKGSVVDHDPSLSKQHPRGWPEGTTWANVPGMSSGNDAVVAVTGHDKNNPHVPATGENHGSSDLTLHEVGHVVDKAGGESSSAAFKNAYSKDKNALPEYEKQAGNAGREEAFAEGMARYYSGDKNMKTSEPNVHKYFSTWEDQHKQKPAATQRPTAPPGKPNESPRNPKTPQ